MTELFDLGKRIAANALGGNSAYGNAERAARLESMIAAGAESRRKAMDYENKRKAREGLPAALRSAGYSEPEIEALTQLQAAGYDPTKSSGYLKDQRETGYRDEAVKRALGGDWAGSNANLMGVASGPQAMQQNMGEGSYVANRFDPGSPVVLDALGGSKVKAIDALGDERTAHAALYGRTDPNIRAPGSVPTYTAPSGASLAASFGGEDGQINGQIVRDFQVWRAANPQFRTGEEALAAYVAQTTPRKQGLEIIDPSIPSSMLRRPPGPAPRGDAPWPDGTRLRRHGVQYVIRNGQPVQE